MLKERRRRIVRRSDTKALSIAEIHVSERSLANAHRVREYGLEDRLQLPGRRRDDLQHLRGRRLLLQAFAQLVEQARVLDSNNGLLGKILDQLYQLIGERPHLLAINGESANQLVFLEHRDGEDCSEPS